MEDSAWCKLSHAKIPLMQITIRYKQSNGLKSLRGRSHVVPFGMLKLFGASHNLHGSNLWLAWRKPPCQHKTIGTFRTRLAVQLSRKLTRLYFRESILDDQASYVYGLADKIYARGPLMSQSKASAYTSSVFCTLQLLPFIPRPNSCVNP